MRYMRGKADWDALNILHMQQPGNESENLSLLRQLNLLGAPWERNSSGKRPAGWWTQYTE